MFLSICLSVLLFLFLSPVPPTFLWLTQKFHQERIGCLCPSFMFIVCAPAHISCSRKEWDLAFSAHGVQPGGENIMKIRKLITACRIKRLIFKVTQISSEAVTFKSNAAGSQYLKSVPSWLTTSYAGWTMPQPLWDVTLLPYSTVGVLLHGSVAVSVYHIQWWTGILKR